MERKQKILALLQSQSDWMGISVVLNLLGEEFKNRTVRRLLGELRDEGLIVRTGLGPSTRYKIIFNTHNPEDNSIVAETQNSAYSSKLIFTKKSLSIIKLVKQPIFHRAPVSYDKNWVDSYIPNKSFYFTDEQRLQMAEKGNRNQLQQIQPAGTYSRKILNHLLMDLSYNSSRLEGNTYSKLDTEKLLVHGIRQDEKMDKERVMILNHKDAIEYLVRQAQRLTVSYQTICTLHYLLADGLLQLDYMGKIRNQSVRIGQSTYLPLEDRTRLENNLINILDKASQIQDPFEQSFYLLIQIAYLQPFMDVNKRTSRLSANISLIKSNYVHLSFNELDKDDYISAMLAVYELNQVSPMADLYCFSYLRTCQAYDATAESVGFDPIRVKYRQQRRALITKVIREKISGKNISVCIQQYSIEDLANIDNNERQEFIKSVKEELKQLTVNTIGGLGIAQSEFEQWQLGGS